MSDLRTEIFTKVLPKMQSLTNLTFDDPEQPVVPVEEKLSNNEIIFNFIKEHPACYATDVCKAVEGSVTPTSTLSQLFALSKRGILHKTKCSTTGNLIYSAAVDAYPNTSRLTQVAKMQEARTKIGKDVLAKRISEGHKRSKLAQAEKQLEKVATKERKNPPTSTAYAPPVVQVTPVDLNTLSIVQARKLYDELKQIFGA